MFWFRLFSSRALTADSEEEVYGLSHFHGANVVDRDWLIPGDQSTGLLSDYPTGKSGFMGRSQLWREWIPDGCLKRS